jgi:hypothetical protein
VLSKVPLAVLNARVSAGTVDALTVKVVLVEMVQAVLRNPKGMQSENTGPFGRSWNTKAASGLLTVTAEQLEMLGEAADGAATMYLADFGLRSRQPDTGWC